eukprot:9401433-Pyramimonas_sp.AAC.1
MHWAVGNPQVRVGFVLAAMGCHDQALWHVGVVREPKVHEPNRLDVLEAHCLDRHHVTSPQNAALPSHRLRY